MFEIEIEDETAMLRFGAQLADALGGRGAVLISGDLGAGKTTLCRGLLRQMGHEGSVKSPTFTLVEPYEIEGVCVYHFDLYRLSHPDELDYVGIDEYFTNETLCLVEWPEKAEGSLPSATAIPSTLDSMDFQVDATCSLAPGSTPWFHSATSRPLWMMAIR